MNVFRRWLTCGILPSPRRSWMGDDRKPDSGLDWKTWGSLDVLPVCLHGWRLVQPDFTSRQMREKVQQLISGISSINRCEPYWRQALAWRTEIRVVCRSHCYVDVHSWQFYCHAQLITTNKKKPYTLDTCWVSFINQFSFRVLTGWMTALVGGVDSNDPHHSAQGCNSCQLPQKQVTVYRNDPSLFLSIRSTARFSHGDPRLSRRQRNCVGFRHSKCVLRWHTCMDGCRVSVWENLNTNKY